MNSSYVEAAVGLRRDLTLRGLALELADEAVESRTDPRYWDVAARIEARLERDVVLANVLPEMVDAAADEGYSRGYGQAEADYPADCPECGAAIVIDHAA
jgi:hypothetical protein